MRFRGNFCRSGPNLAQNWPHSVRWLKIRPSKSVVKFGRLWSDVGKRWPTSSARTRSKCDRIRGKSVGLRGPELTELNRARPNSARLHPNLDVIDRSWQKLACILGICGPRSGMRNALSCPPGAQTFVFFLKPEVPGIWPSMGAVFKVLTSKEPSSAVASAMVLEAGRTRGLVQSWRRPSAPSAAWATMSHNR